MEAFRVNLQNDHWARQWHRLTDEWDQERSVIIISKTGQCSRIEMRDEHLEDVVKEWPSPRLRLIEIVKTDERAWHLGQWSMEPGHFARYVRSIEGFDTGALWLFFNSCDGFHYFPGADQDTYFFGFSFFAAIWTYDRISASTSAIYFSRNSQGQSAFHMVFGLLTELAEHARAPAFLPVALAQTIISRNAVFRGDRAWSRLRQVEVQTGFTPDGQALRETLELDQLTHLIQETGAILVDIVSIKRTMKMITSMLEYFADAKSLDTLPKGSEKDRSDVLYSTKHLIEAIPICKNIIGSTEDYMEYLKVRTERLNAVVFAFMTHKDAQTSIEQALASRELAEAAKKDSSAMKTIAVMTMAFLPATFFAALFALPTLDWKSGDGSVVQPNHWVYWAFTGPATVLVFVIWIVLNNRHWVTRLVRAGIERRSAARSARGKENGTP